MELKIKIDVKGALLKGKAPEIVQAGLDRFVQEAVQFLHGQIISRTPQGRYGSQGGLIGSIIPKPITGKGTPLVKGVIVTASKYGEVIEKGRRAGKGIPPQKDEKGNYTIVPWIMTKMGLSKKEAMKIEYVIRRKIGIKGFEGRHMFEKAVSENQGVLDAMAERHGLNISTGLSG